MPCHGGWAHIGGSPGAGEKKKGGEREKEKEEKNDGRDSVYFIENTSVNSFAYGYRLVSTPSRMDTEWVLS
jgi:hypothetical protein